MRHTSSAPEQCNALLPPEAVIGRIGGEEFAIMLPGADESRAMAALEAVRRHIAGRPVPTQQGEIIVTMSVGVATLNARSEVTLDQLLDRADQALYQAKRGGRNRTCAFATDPGVEDTDQPHAPGYRDSRTPIRRRRDETQ